MKGIVLAGGAGRVGAVVGCGAGCGFSVAEPYVQPYAASRGCVAGRHVGGVGG